MKNEEFKLADYYMPAYVIDWVGPFEDSELTHRFLAKEFEWPEYQGNGLYFIVGKLPYKKKIKIHYIGITEEYFSTRFNNHDKRNMITRDRKTWLGKIYQKDGLSRTELETI